MTGAISLAISIAALIISLFTVVINSKRNKINRDNFNIARIKGDTNKRFWVTAIYKFLDKNNQHIKFPKDLDLENAEDYDNYVKRKYYQLLEMAYSGELNTDNMLQCIELIFSNCLKESYWKTNYPNSYLNPQHKMVKQKTKTKKI